MGELLEWNGREQICIGCGNEFFVQRKTHVMNEDALYCRKCQSTQIPSENKKAIQIDKIMQKIEQRKPTLGELMIWAKQEAIGTG